jgi:PBSX family phage terminase large subunit
MSTALDALLGKLSRKQIESIAFSRDQKVAIWHGAVSSGKTFASLIAFLIAVRNAPKSGLIVICGRTLQTIERNILDPLMDPALFGGLSRYVKHTTGATTAVILGRVVHLIGANDVRAEGRIRGATIGLAMVDEASLVPQSFWMMLLSRLRVPGAENRLLATTNPDNPTHWLRKDFILRGADVGVVSFQFGLDDNPALDQDYKDLLRRQYTGLWFRRFILGHWCLAEGSVFDMWDPDVHVVADVPQVTKWICAGIDYGTRNPFAAVLLGVGVDRKLYAVSEWRWDSQVQRRQLTAAEYAARVREWLASPTPDRPAEPPKDRPELARLRDVAPPYLVIDPSASAFREQCHRDQMRPWPADNDVTNGIQVMSTLLADRQFLVAKRCEGLIDEFPSYVWDPVAAQAGIDQPIKVGDHSLDATRYGIYTTQSMWRPMLALAA